MEALELRAVRLHGHEVSYYDGGSGPALVLIHGIASRAATWRGVASRLVETNRVVAPDLLGHGGSAKPRGDYSLGAFASGIRDLMGVLGIERATIVGHSLGGGVAMQFAYQYPQRCERLVLVSSGGLGTEVSPILRAVALPGAEYVMPAAWLPPLRRASAAASGWLERAGLRPPAAVAEVWGCYESLGDPEARRAFVHTLRSVIDLGGQRVSALDRLYLARHVPTQIVWGSKDRIIPVAHATSAHRAIPGSRLELFEGGGHFPQVEEPARFVRVLRQFMNQTRPARFTEVEWQRLLRSPRGARGGASRPRSAAGSRPARRAAAS